MSEPIIDTSAVMEKIPGGWAECKAISDDGDPCSWHADCIKYQQEVDAAIRRLVAETVVRELNDLIAEAMKAKIDRHIDAAFRMGNAVYAKSETWRKMEELK